MRREDEFRNYSEVDSMTNQMPPKMKQELENILEDMQALEMGMWELIAMSEAVIQANQFKAARKAVNEKLSAAYTQSSK